MYTYIFVKLIRVIPVSAVLSRVPYGYVFLHIARIRVLHTKLDVFEGNRLAYSYKDTMDITDESHLFISKVYRDLDRARAELVRPAADPRGRPGARGI